MNIIDNCAYKIIFYSEKGTGSTRLKQTISQLNSVIKNDTVCGPEKILSQINQTQAQRS